MLKKFIIRTFVITACLIVVYLAFFVAPKLSAQQQDHKRTMWLMNQKSRLVGINSAWFELGQLEPRQAAFSEYRNGLISSIDEKTTKADAEIKNSPSKELSDSTRQTITSNRKLLSDLRSFDRAAAKLYEYNPQADIGVLDLNKDADKIAGRALAASNGLKKVSESLPRNRVDKNLLNEIESTREELRSLTLAISQRNFAAAEALRPKLVGRIEKLQDSLWYKELDIIRNEEVGKIFLETKKLIKKYEETSLKTRT